MYISEKTHSPGYPLGKFQKKHSQKLCLNFFPMKRLQFDTDDWHAMEAGQSQEPAVFNESTCMINIKNTRKWEKQCLQPSTCNTLLCPGFSPLVKYMYRDNTRVAMDHFFFFCGNLCTTTCKFQKHICYYSYFFHSLDCPMPLVPHRRHSLFAFNSV